MRGVRPEIVKILETFEEGSIGIVSFVCDDGVQGDFDFEIANSRLVFPTEEGGNVTQILKLIKAKEFCGKDLYYIVRVFPERDRVGDPTQPKHLFSWMVLDGEEIVPLTASELIDAHCTDHETGELLDPEPYVVYKDAWEV